jgi:hypothetical protein
MTTIMKPSISILNRSTIVDTSSFDDDHDDTSTFSYGATNNTSTFSYDNDDQDHDDNNSSSSDSTFSSHIKHDTFYAKLLEDFGNEIPTYKIRLAYLSCSRNFESTKFELLNFLALQQMVKSKLSNRRNDHFDGDKRKTTHCFLNKHSKNKKHQQQHKSVKLTSKDYENMMKLLKDVTKINIK